MDMPVEQLIEAYMADQPEPKQTDIRTVHEAIQNLSPGCRLWFTDGKNEHGKVVANPNIGYGEYTIRYKDGTTKEFFRIGLSANTSGLSVYVMGLPDKGYLKANFAQSIGKASITGYCIKFKRLKDIDLDALCRAVSYGFDQSS